MADLDSPLAQSILKQVEYYFSRQNLQSDHYLVSKMNPQLYVPLGTVAGFKMLRNITSDLDLIKRVLRTSKKIQLDESGKEVMIRPYLPSVGRTTIILRELPKDTKPEEVKTIFPNPSKIVTVRPDIEDTWFVTFESDEACKEAYNATLDATFRGNPVKARIKSENLLKSFIPEIKGHAAEQPPMQPPIFMPAFSSFGAPPGLPYPFLMSAGMSGGFRPPFGPPPPFPEFYAPITIAPPVVPAGQADSGAIAESTGAGGGSRRGGGSGPQGSRPQGSRGRGTGRGQALTGDLGRSPNKRNGPPKVVQPKPGPQDFPPLPTASSQTRGYTEAFKQFTKAEIIAVLSALQSQEVPLPADIPSSCVAVSKEIIGEIELLRTPEQPADPSADAAASDAAAAPTAAAAAAGGGGGGRPKTFAEAAISAQDIKAPEKTRRPAGKPGYGSGEADQGYDEVVIPSQQQMQQQRGGRGNGGYPTTTGSSGGRGSSSRGRGARGSRGGGRRGGGGRASGGTNATPQVVDAAPQAAPTEAS